MNNLAEQYYEHAYGYYPFDVEAPRVKTQNIIEYLLDNDIPQKDIVGLIEQSSRFQRGHLDPFDISSCEVLWRDSLLKPNTFYYHEELQIRPHAPVFNPMSGTTTSVPFYLEMRIRYSVIDIVRYARKQLRLPIELADDKRDSGSVEFLLKKYSKLTNVTAIDFVLALIDAAKDNERRITSILDVSNYEQLVFEHFERMIPELKVKKADTIVWR